MVSVAIVTNAVFNRDDEAMFQPTISDFDKADILFIWGIGLLSDICRFAAN